MSIFKRSIIVFCCFLIPVALFYNDSYKTRAASLTTSPENVPATSQVVLLTPQNIPGVENFAKVSDGLYRGAQPTAEGFAELKKRGIKTVVNLRSFHSDRDKLKGLGLQYANIDCKAWHPEEEDVIKFLKIVLDPTNQPVFVHCQHGADRTGYMVASYRIVEQGWSTDDAIKEIHNFGFHTVWKDIPKYLQDMNVQTIKRKVEAAPAPKLELIP
jgi:tyrosine-protein phosphatase SIW14